MYEQLLHTQCNGSTSGFNATCVLQGYLSRNMTHTVLPKLTAWPWNSYNSPAEYCRLQKGLPKRPLIILHPKCGRSLTYSHFHGGWFSQERRPEIKLNNKGWSAWRNQKTGRLYPRKCWVTLVALWCKDSLMWIVLSHHWLCKKQRLMVTVQTQLMITTNWAFSWKHNAVEYLKDTLTNPRVNAKYLWFQHKHMCKYML